MTDKKTTQKKSPIFILGVGLIGVSCLLWLSVLAVPALPFSNSTKAGVTVGILVAGEITFWLGALCTGKEFIQKYKEYFMLKKDESKNK